MPLSLGKGVLREMRKALARVLFWTYPRGSWQYDVFCIVIILFIFLTPARVFDRSLSEEAVNSVEELVPPGVQPDATSKTDPGGGSFEEEQELPHLARSKTSHNGPLEE